MTFLQKYELVKKSVPVPAVINGLKTINSVYCDDSLACKNCVISVLMR